MTLLSVEMTPRHRDELLKMVAQRRYHWLEILASVPRGGHGWTVMHEKLDLMEELRQVLTNARAKA